MSTGRDTLNDNRLAVFFGTYDTASHPRVQVLIDGFRSAGWEVIELNRPLEFPTASRVRLMQQPWRAPSLLAQVVRQWIGLRSDARGLAGQLGDRSIDLVVVGYLGQFDIQLGSRLFSAPIALDYLVGMGDTALDRGSGSIVARLLQWIDRRATAAADLVLVDTIEQARICPPATEPVIVPVGAPNAWYREPTSTKGHGLDVIFFGLFTPLQGTPYIGDAMQLLVNRPDINFTLIGSGQDRAECERRAGSAAARATWIDWLPPNELIAEVSRHDVCLGIFGATPKARRVVPNKAYQGAAAGCAVVTSDTAPQRNVFGENAIMCPPEDGEAIARSLILLADDAEVLARKRRQASDLAASFRPDKVVAAIIQKLESAP